MKLIDNRYIRKSQLVYAVRYTGKNLKEIKKLLADSNNKIMSSGEYGDIIISTAYGSLKVIKGNWIIKETEDIISNIPNDIFDSLFIPIENYNKEA